MRGRPARRADCHPQRKHKAFGWCRPCHERRTRVADEILAGLGNVATEAEQERRLKTYIYNSVEHSLMLEKKATPNGLRYSEHGVPVSLK